MIGKFGYHRNCSLLHFLPPGESKDGMPVIVFPHRNHQAVEGRTYDFVMSMSREATYTIDGVKYRVAHATAFTDITGKEAGYLDILIGKGDSMPPVTLGDTPGGQVLAALKSRFA